MIKWFFDTLCWIAVLLFMLTIFLVFYFLGTKDDETFFDLEESMYIDEIYHSQWKYIIWNRTSWPVFWWDVYSYTSICD